MVHANQVVKEENDPIIDEDHEKVEEEVHPVKIAGKEIQH